MRSKEEGAMQLLTIQPTRYDRKGLLDTLRKIEAVDDELKLEELGLDGWDWRVIRACVSVIAEAKKKKAKRKPAKC
jgi:hypothetical protein